MFILSDHLCGEENESKLGGITPEQHNKQIISASRNPISVKLGEYGK